MNREFKVGLAVFLALIALGGIVFITGGALFRHGGNMFDILFDDAMGLEIGAPAYVSGLESGAVRSLRLVPEGVIVTVVLDSAVKIPKDSRILIGTGGLLGKPLLRIERGTSQDFIAPGERLHGEIPPDFDALLEELRNNLKVLGATFGHFNDLFGDPERKERLGKALDNLPGFIDDGRTAMRRIGAAGEEIRELGRLGRLQIKSLSESLTSLSRNLDRVVLENKVEIRNSISSLASLLDRLDKTFAQFDEDGLAGSDLRETIQNLSNAAKGVEKLSGNLSGALGDFSGGSDASETAKGLKKTIASAGRIVSAVESIQASGEVAIQHKSSEGSEENGWAMDLSLLIGKTDSPWGLLLEGHELGNGSSPTAAAAYRTAWGRVWAGLVRGDVGAGALLDLQASRIPLSFSAEWWDDQGGSWAARGKWHINPRWGIFYERLEPGRDSPDDVVGLFYQF
ncbi:MAG: MlaD family protein [Synergistales bacterium]